MGQEAPPTPTTPWAVAYEITVDGRWRTLRARVAGRGAAGAREVTLEADEAGGWRIDGVPAPDLDRCLDVDLESSVYTNALPARRLGLAVGDRASAPAAYVRAPDLRVEPLGQCYARIEDDGPHRRYDYSASAFDFRCELIYDESGLLLEYPGIAVRVA
jgi:hypothetical protein